MHKKRQRQSKCKKLVTVLQIQVQIPSDMAAATQGISVLIDQLFLACALLCKFTTCLLCLTKNSSCVLAPSCAISSSAATLFDGGEALCYLDCCSICITTIIICMYLIRTVISFIWVTGFFFFPLSLVILLVQQEKQLLPSMVAKTCALSVTHSDKGRAHIMKLLKQ